MDKWDRMHETDAQSQLESPLLRQEQAAGDGSRRRAVPSSKSSLVPGAGLGVRVPGLTRCPRLSPRCALLSEHGAGGLRWCDALPLINARLLPSCDSLSISVATRLFRKGNRHESVGLKVVILYRVAQKA